MGQRALPSAGPGSRTTTEPSPPAFLQRQGKALQVCTSWLPGQLGIKTTPKDWCKGHGRASLAASPKAKPPQPLTSLSEPWADHLCLTACSHPSHPGSQLQGTPLPRRVCVCPHRSKSSGTLRAFLHPHTNSQGTTAVTPASQPGPPEALLSVPSACLVAANKWLMGEKHN